MLHKLGKIEVIIKCPNKIIKIFNELFPFNFMQFPPKKLTGFIEY